MLSKGMVGAFAILATLHFVPGASRADMIGFAGSARIAAGEVHNRYVDIGGVFHDDLLNGVGDTIDIALDLDSQSLFEDGHGRFVGLGAFSIGYFQTLLPRSNFLFITLQDAAPGFGDDVL